MSLSVDSAGLFTIFAVYAISVPSGDQLNCSAPPVGGSGQSARRPRIRSVGSAASPSSCSAAT